MQGLYVPAWSVRVNPDWVAIRVSFRQPEIRRRSSRRLYSAFYLEILVENGCWMLAAGRCAPALVLNCFFFYVSCMEQFPKLWINEFIALILWSQLSGPKDAIISDDILTCYYRRCPLNCMFAMKTKYLIIPVLFLIIGCGKQSLYKKDGISDSYNLKGASCQKKQKSRRKKG